MFKTSRHKSAEIEMRRMMVTPPMARHWLERNIRNRPISQPAVLRYRADMVAGRWMYAGDPIRFSVEETLLDGQHRLHALGGIEDDEFSIPLLVVWGLPPETQFVMDQGKKRSTAQQLALTGIKNYVQIAGGAKRYIAWSTGTMFRNSRETNMISTPMIQQWVQEHPEKVKLHAEVAGAIRSLLCRPSVSTAAAFIFSDANPLATIEFFQTLDRGVFEDSSPLLALTRCLQKISRSGVTASDRDLLGYFILAWNAWRRNRHLTHFRRPSGGRWTAQNFPQVAA